MVRGGRVIHPAIATAALVMPPGFDHPEIPIWPALLEGRGLRDYQLLMLLEAARLMRLGYRRILIQAPTGAGKTVMAAALMGSASVLAMTSEFMVHRKELITQTSKSFEDRGLVHGFIASKRPLDLGQWITLAGVQTLVNRLDSILPPDVAIIDECHHATSDTWARVLAYYGDAYVIGFTATPERLDGRGLDEHFDAIVKGPSVAELIARGFLSPFEFYAPEIPDMTGIASTAGEFNRGAAADVVDRPKVIGNIVEHYLRLAPGEQGIVFAASREHSRNIADAFNAEGVRAMHVDGSMSDDQRDYFDEAFRAGEITMGVNVDLFGEGYDVPNISYVGDGAPSRSKIKVLQRWGRALRLFPGKSRAIICDHAGNAVDRQMGLPDDDRDWSLAGREKKARSTGCNDDAEPVTQCKICFRVRLSAQRVCPGCGDETAPKPRRIDQKDGQLTKLEREAMKRAAAERRKAEEKECKDFAAFLSLAKVRGYDRPRGWAFNQCRLRRIPVPPS